HCVSTQPECAAFLPLARNRRASHPNSAPRLTGEKSGLATGVRVEKERGFRFNGFFENKVFHALNVYYDDVIQALVKSMRDAFSNAAHLPKLKQPIPMVLSGGTAMPVGFQ